MKWLNRLRIRFISIAYAVVVVAGACSISSATDNLPPIADAGLPRYAAADAVVLDGTGSFDPDNSGALSYTWLQIAGPSAMIKDANTATPTIGMESGLVGRDGLPKIGGFIQTHEIQECEFELVVSDGELESLPDTVTVIIVPDFGASTLQQANPPFDPNKPTIIYFGGGDCVIGHAGNILNDSSWNSQANVISFPDGYGRDSVKSAPTYYKYGDMIIAHLSAVAPDYTQPIQTIGFSTGGMPAMDSAIRINRAYEDTRYAINRVTGLDAPCRLVEVSNDVIRPTNAYIEALELFLGSAVDGEQCWYEQYAQVMLDDIARGGIRVDLVWIGHVAAQNWYLSSLTSPQANEFNNGVIGGAYWSVVGPGKNLQISQGVDYRFRLLDDTMQLADEQTYPARLPEPVTLAGPEDGAFVDANGVVLSCEVSENAVGYQLLFGSEPYRVMDYTIVSDTPEPPSDVITTFPFEQTFWTVRVYDEYGSTIYADPICIYPENVVTASEYLVAHWKLDETDGEIAYDSISNNDAIVHEGAWIPGKIDRALDFNGLNTYMDCGDSDQLAPEQMTISMWLKPEHMGGMRYIAARSEPDTDEIDYAITRQSNGEVDFVIGQLDSEPVSVTSIGTTPLGEWTHVAVTLDGSAASIYIDGQPDNSSVYSQRIQSAGYRLIISSLGADTRFYNGLIDDVRIYDRAVAP